MLFMTGTALALTLASPMLPPPDKCRDVRSFDDGNVTFIDLANRYYVEYRRAEIQSPPQDSNPDGYQIHFRFMLTRDLASDAVIGSTLTVEMRHRVTDRVILPPDDSEQQFSATRIGGVGAAPAVSVATDYMALMPTPDREVGGLRITSAAPGALELHRHIVAGGTIRLDYRQVYRGGTLTVGMETAFPENPAHHAESRAAAREAADRMTETGVCPLRSS